MSTCMLFIASDRDNFWLFSCIAIHITGHNNQLAITSSYCKFNSDNLGPQLLCSSKRQVVCICMEAATLTTCNEVHDIVGMAACPGYSGIIIITATQIIHALAYTILNLILHVRMKNIFEKRASGKGHQLLHMLNML